MKNKIKTTTSIILALVMLVSVFSLNSCKNEKDKEAKEKESIETKAPESENKEIEETEEATKTEENSKDSETEETEESDIISTEPPVTAEKPIFEYNENGYIKGSPADYDSIVISVGGYEYTAKEYFADNKNAIATWSDIASEGAVKEHYTENIISTSYDNMQQVNSLGFMANSYAITYGRMYDHGENADALDFSLNGIRVGDSIDRALEIFGEKEPSTTIGEGKNFLIYPYVFENTGTLIFTVHEGKINCIRLQLSY
ncbi:MAG: hypothetical protein E7591_09470 [Ruminococcaceae bacterium]|nr:hypothetical protein [Oscillospiraceae bacterium]